MSNSTLQKITVSSDGKLYNSEGVQISKDVQYINGSAIRNETGAVIKNGALTEMFSGAYNVLEWFVKNWQLTLLGALAIFLLIRRL